MVSFLTKSDLRHTGKGGHDVRWKVTTLFKLYLVSHAFWTL